METNLQLQKQQRTKTGIWSSQRQPVHEWVPSDVPSDITIELDGIALPLHKFPLASRSARIRKMIAQVRSPRVPIRVELPGVPGGVESFLMAAQFSYGVHVDMTAANIAQLRCVSEYLEMTEACSQRNLISKCEEHFESVIRNSFDMSIQVLGRCLDLLPLADELGIVSRCIDSIVEQIASSASESGGDSMGMADSSDKWWIEGLSSLGIGMYEKAISALRRRGVRPGSIGASLVHYAQNELINKPRNRKKSTHLSKDDLPASHGRDVVETIAGLLPDSRSAVPVPFLFGLLRSATMLDCSASCREELERRIGLGLDEASVDDLLMPSLRHAEDVLFDVEMVQRMLMNFCQQKRNEEKEEEGEEEATADTFPTQSAIIKVSKLMDDYLAEIAQDTNLKLDQFLAIAQALPAHARTVHDGLYRAVDMYLKGHESLPECDRKRLCKLINYQLLTPEAAAHAAQNETLPLRSIVQVLYYEQLRMRNALFFSHGEEISKALIEQQQSLQPLRITTGNLSESIISPSPRDHYASLRWENRELKLELARLRMRMNDLERQHLRRSSKVQDSSLITIGSIFRKLLPMRSRAAPSSRNSSEAGSRNKGRR